jgi:hypothetical protein
MAGLLNRHLWWLALRGLLADEALQFVGGLFCLYER